MSLIANAKAKMVAGNVSEAFKNEEGAIDLASIMVGIIVIGLIGGVIAATVFAVIPWAQDNAAKQQLDSVASAESAYVGLSTQGSAATFGSATDLSNQKLFDAAAAKVDVKAVGSGSGAHYAAAIKSGSGNVFYISDKKTQPSPNNQTAAVAVTVDLGSDNAVGGTGSAADTIINVTAP